VKEKESQTLYSRHVSTGKVVKQIASMFRRAGGEKIKTEGKRGQWVVVAFLTCFQAAKFISLESDRETKEEKRDGQV